MYLIKKPTGENNDKYSNEVRNKAFTCSIMRAFKTLASSLSSLLTPRNVAKHVWSDSALKALFG